MYALQANGKVRSLFYFQRWSKNVPLQLEVCKQVKKKSGRGTLMLLMDLNSDIGVFSIND